MNAETRARSDSHDGFETLRTNEVPSQVVVQLSEILLHVKTWISIQTATGYSRQHAERGDVHGGRHAQEEIDADLMFSRVRRHGVIRSIRRRHALQWLLLDVSSALTASARASFELAESRVRYGCDERHHFPADWFQIFNAGFDASRHRARTRRRRGERLGDHLE